MAKKQVKSIKLNASEDVKDFTIKDEHKAIIRFNKECVLELLVNTESLTASIQCTNEKNNKKYRLNGNLEEVE